MKTLAMLALALGLACLGAPACAQDVLFDFDAGPVQAPLPLDQLAGGITAHFSATGDGYSIQPVGTLGLSPVGFAGNCLYPSGIATSDLVIAFDHVLTGISLLYAPDELATDSSATIKLTAYLGVGEVGSNTATAVPGTWPSATLAFSSLQHFDNVVVHYQSPPPTGGDYGTIFMVDDVLVTPAPEPAAGAAGGAALLALVRGRVRRAS